MLELCALVVAKCFAKRRDNLKLGNSKWNYAGADWRIDQLGRRLEESISLKLSKGASRYFLCREHAGCATTAGFLLTLGTVLCYVTKDKNLLQPMVGFLSNFFTGGLGI